MRRCAPPLAHSTSLGASRARAEHNRNLFYSPSLYRSKVFVVQLVVVECRTFVMWTGATGREQLNLCNRFRLHTFKFSHSV